MYVTQLKKKGLITRNDFGKNIISKCMQPTVPGVGHVYQSNVTDILSKTVKHSSCLNTAKYFL